MKMIVLILSNTVFLLASTALAEPPSLFDGHLALIEVVSADPFDASGNRKYTVPSKPRVHNVIARVVQVYDGSDNLVGKRFPLTPPPYFAGDPETLTPADLSFEGVADADKLNIGAKAVLTLYFRKDFDPMKLNLNPFRFPDRSVFAILHAPGFGFSNAWPELFEKRLEWAEAIKRFNAIKDDNDRINYLKQAIRSDNPLLAVTAVHLLRRFYPQEAEKHFDEIILAPGVPVYARLAMDHEFCLSRGQAWVNGKQKELEPILEMEASEVPEGSGLLSFRKQMIGNGSWFGGRGERE